MNRIYFTLALLFTVTLCHAQDNSTILKDYGLKGNVNTTTTYNYFADYRDGKWVPRDSIQYEAKNIYIFYEGNRKVEQVIYQYPEKLFRREVAEYKDGVFQKKTIYNADSEIISVMLKTQIDPENANFRITDGDNNLKETATATYSNGYMLGTKYNTFEVKYTYDEDWNRIGYEHKAEFGNYSAKIEYLEYDLRGNWTKMIGIDQGDTSMNNLVIRTIEYYD